MARDRRGGGRTQLEFWAMGAEGERIQGLIAAFEREHPQIRVRIHQIPWSAAHEKLLTAFAGDSLPDLCQLGNTWLAEFAALHALEDLTDRVAASSIVAPAAFFPGAWDGNLIGRRVLGLPWYVDTRLLFWRTDLLSAAGHAAPPRSWDEWMRAMRDVKTRARRSAGASDVYAALLPVNEFEQPVIFGLQAGADLLPDDGRRGNFSGREFRRAFDFYVNIFREDLAPRLSNTRISNVWQEFERGTFAMYITGPWNVREFRQRMSSAMTGRWTTAPLAGPDENYPGVSLAGGCSLVIFRQSKQKSAAWQLAEFLSTTERQIEMFLATSNLPARKSAWNSDALRADAEYAAFHEQLERVQPAPRVPEWEEIVTGELVKTAEAVIGGRQEIGPALVALDRQVDRLLEKRRWMLAQGAIAAL